MYTMYNNSETIGIYYWSYATCQYPNSEKLVNSKMFCMWRITKQTKAYFFFEFFGLLIVCRSVR